MRRDRERPGEMEEHKNKWRVTNVTDVRINILLFSVFLFPASHPLNNNIERKDTYR